MKLAILGMGPVCALGSGTEALRQALRGETVPYMLLKDLGGEVPAAQGIHYASKLEGIEKFIEPRLLRRLDKFTQMALLSSHLCMQDTGIVLEHKERVGVVFGTSYGALRTTFAFLDGVIEQGDGLASPTLFANSVHNAPASQVTISLQLAGPCTTLTGFEHTALNVFRTAELWLQSGEVDYVLAGLGDEYCEVLGYAAFNLGKEQKMDYLPGEGFITFLLGSAAAGQDKYGNIERLDLYRLEKEQLSEPGLQELTALTIHNSRCQFNKQTLAAFALDKIPVTSHVSWYGRMMTGIGFEIAFAALALQAAVLVPAPAPEKFYKEGLNWLKEPNLLNKHAQLGCLGIGGRLEGEDVYEFYKISD